MRVRGEREREEDGRGFVRSEHDLIFVWIQVTRSTERRDGWELMEITEAMGGNLIEKKP